MRIRKSGIIKTGMMWSAVVLLTGALSAVATAQPNTPPPPPPETKPAPQSYRVVYTLTESENGNTLGVQREEVLVTTDSYTFVRLDSKVPIRTDPNSQVFSHEDVGLSINAQLQSVSGEIELISTIDQPSLEDPQKSTASQPIIRQLHVRNVAVIEKNKSVVLDQLDLPGSNHHLKIEATVTKLQ